MFNTKRDEDGSYTVTDDSGYVSTGHDRYHARSVEATRVAKYQSRRRWE